MNSKAIRKQLLAAVAMVLVAAVALGSSTYAWFASNNTVTAKGMQVQATAEGGIEIAYNALSTTKIPDSGAAAYATTATAGMDSGTVLFPTSTQAVATNGAISSGWFHANAALASNYQAKEGTYTTLTLNAGNDQNNIYGSTTIKQDKSQYYDTAGRQYYLVKQFNVRSVSGTKLASNLKVKSVTVTLPQTANTQALDKSVRVAVVCGSNSAIYAPVPGASGTYAVANAIGADGKPTATTQVTALGATVESSVLADSIPAITSDGKYGGVDVNIYVYYEGEDSNHYSDNLKTDIDTLQVSVDFTAAIEGANA